MCQKYGTPSADPEVGNDRSSQPNGNHPTNAMETDKTSNKTDENQGVELSRLNRTDGNEISRQERNMSNQVDGPSHYQLGQNRQVIDILVETLTPNELRGFVLGNIIKYITRSAYKGKELEDLQKAMWYLNWYINKIKSNNHENVLDDIC